jgi:hypothetical protein
MKPTLITMTLVFLWVCPIPGTHARDLQTDFRQWAQFSLDPRIIAELERFQDNDQRLSSDYRETLPTAVRSLMVAAVEQQLQGFLEGRCEPSVTVSYLSPGFAIPGYPLSTVAKRFEEGFVRLEVVACFLETPRSAQEALRIYTAPEFRMAVSSTIQRIWEERDSSCVETKGVTAILDPTYYCNHIEELSTNGLAVQHSQVIANKGQPPYQEVYFKESFKTFVEIPQGLVFHYLNYSRSARIGKLKRYLGKKAIIRSQKSALDKLQQRLNAPTP